MKKISIMIPCYNEEDNIKAIVLAIKQMLKKDLATYDYEIIIIDNKSVDNTRNIIRGLCQEDKKIKAIFNLKNFGQFNSPFYGLMQCTGDCVIPVAADFQDPIELIPQMIHKWEDGHKVVCMIKTSSKEGKVIYSARKLYYWLISKLSSIDQIKQFTGFGLYDQSYIELMRNLNEPTPFIRGIIAEYAPDCCKIEFEQPKRKAGKSSNNFFSLFDAAMISFTSYTNCLRIATFVGFSSAMLSFVIGIVYLVLKFVRWNSFSAGMAPLLIAMFFIGGVMLFCMGMLGEYIIAMNKRVMNRPLVFEEERMNFDE